MTDQTMITAETGAIAHEGLLDDWMPRKELAGIIGITRREKSNVIPGVAIATALMPPLCTAGYGLANGDWAMFGGAFYLFSINCVFIAFSAVLIIDFLRLPHRKFIDKAKEKRVKRALLAREGAAIGPRAIPSL